MSHVLLLYSLTAQLLPALLVIRNHVKERRRQDDTTAALKAKDVWDYDEPEFEQRRKENATQRPVWKKG